MTEGKLPSGWRRVRLSDVILDVATVDPLRTSETLYTYYDISSIDNEAGTIVSPKIVKGADAPSRARQVVVEGDTLFSTVRPGLRAIALVPGSSNPVASTGFCVLRPAPGINPRFLFYYARSEEFIRTVLMFQRGVSYPAVRAGDVVNQSIPIAPSAEQSRIVPKLEELLSDLDTGVAELRAAQKKLTQYRQSLLKAAVEGALTAEWRKHNKPKESGAQLLERILKERRARWEEKPLAKFKEQGKAPPKGWREKYSEPVEPDTANLPALPEGWIWASVEQSGEVRLGRQRAPQHHHGANMRPYLRVANVHEARLDLTDVKEMNFTPEEFKTYSLRSGDVLLNEGQSPELVGRPAMYKGEIPGCCYQKTLLRFRAYEGICAEWSLIVFRSYLHSGRFRRSASITTSIGHLAAERFIRIEFPVPPEAEQQAIIELVDNQLSAVERIEADLEVKLKSSQALRRSILRAAFSGKLIPQDPNDEPASLLLERIRAEREAQQNMMKVTQSSRHNARARAAG